MEKEGDCWYCFIQEHEACTAISNPKPALSLSDLTWRGTLSIGEGEGSFYYTYGIKLFKIASIMHANWTLTLFLKIELTLKLLLPGSVLNII